MRLTILCLVGWFSAVVPAQAWNAAGHKIIASIAFRQLTAGEQAAVIELLKRHPRFAVDFADLMPAEVRSADDASQREWLFQQAAVWPDTVRGGPPEKRAFHRGEWHYVNVPLFLDDATRESLQDQLAVNLAMEPPEDATTDTPRMNVVQVIRFAEREISRNEISLENRAVLLSWLFHNVGDIHQPLHSTALFSKRLFPEGDRGGNSVKTVQAGNLHALWDQFPGQVDEFRGTRNRAIALVHDTGLAKIGSEATATLDAERWNSESHELAKTVVYDNDVLAALKSMESGGGAIEPMQLSERYLKAGGGIAEQRIAQAGFRLGAVLRELFK